MIKTLHPKSDDYYRHNFTSKKNKMKKIEMFRSLSVAQKINKNFQTGTKKTRNSKLNLTENDILKTNLPKCAVLVK